MTLAAAFASYRRKVIPEDASAEQVLETQLGFYAGAMSMMRLILDASEGDEDRASDRLATLHAECEAFAAQTEPPIPPPPDIHHTAPNADEFRPLLERLGHELGDRLPDGLGFALFLFEFGPGGSLFYISNGTRSDVLTALQEYMRRQVQ